MVFHFKNTTTGLLLSLLFLGGQLFSSCQKDKNPVIMETKTSEQNQRDNDPQKTKNMSTIHLTKAEFLTKVADFENNPTEWKYLGDKPALIDFYASWCGPCKMVSPILEELAKEYEGKIYIYKINTEEERELSADFGIRSIPTLLFVPMKGKPQMAQGAMSKADFKQAIDSILLNQ